MAEPEAPEVMEPAVREARQTVEERRAAKEEKPASVNWSSKVWPRFPATCATSRTVGEISDEDHWDGEFTAHLRQLVQREPEADLTGDETIKAAHDLARDAIDAEM